MANDIELGPLTATDIGVVYTEDFLEEKVNTNFGNITVGVAGDRKKHAIITYHDIGLNANSCFQSFFQFSEMAALAEKFCVYHINAPGQEDDASPLPDSYVYPSMEDLAQTVAAVADIFGIKSFIGFGVGAGANVLVRYALKHPKKVDGLILVNCTIKGSSWTEWGYQKVNINYLRSKGITSFTVDYLMSHHFGKHIDQCNPDMVASYRQYFSRLPNPSNLAKFFESYLGRSAISLVRDGATLDCAVLQLVGAKSSHIDDTVDVNSKLDPKKSDWMKVTDSSGLILEDRPDKVTEAVVLFLQGLGYFPAFPTRLIHQQSLQRSSSIHLAEPTASEVPENLSNKQRASIAVVRPAPYGASPHPVVT